MDGLPSLFSPWVSFDLSGIFLFDSGEASFPGGIFTGIFSHRPDHPKPTLRSRYSPKGHPLSPVFCKKRRRHYLETVHFQDPTTPILSFPTIEENFRRSFSNLGKDFSLHSSQVSDSLQLEVKVMGQTTHQLTFIYLKPLALKPGLRPKVAIVIDDLGGENHISRELLRWNLPLTFSILPFTPYSKTLASEAHQKGKEVILHLPMEPHGYPEIKPGEGVLLAEMDEEKLLRQLSKDIEGVPYIKGVSNHMGSRLMEDPEKVKIILSELKRRGLFFLDSRTTPQTVGLQTADSIGLKATERTLFLDHSSDEDDVKQKLERLIEISLSTGKAIGIGHPHSSTIKSLKEMIPKMKKKGIDIVPLSSVME